VRRSRLIGHPPFAFQIVWELLGKRRTVPGCREVRQASASIGRLETRRIGGGSADQDDEISDLPIMTRRCSTAQIESDLSYRPAPSDKKETRAKSAACPTRIVMEQMTAFKNLIPRRQPDR
jgi:hypothetical protein